MPRRSTLWLASCAAMLGAFAVTSGVLIALATRATDHEAIHADRLGERGFVAARPASTAPTSAASPTADTLTTKPSPLAMRLKDDGEGPSAGWPPGFQATPDRPTPLTMCLKHDSIDGKPICPNAQTRDTRSNALTMPLR